MRRYTRRELAAARLNILPACVYDAFPTVLFGRALVLATRLGIFEELARRPQSAEELAGTLGLSPKPLELILAALVETSYLTCRDRRYSPTRQTAKWLLRSSPSYVGNFLAYIELLHDHWSHLEHTLRTGAPPRTYRDLFGPREWQIYTLGMMDLATMVLPSLRRLLQPPGHPKRLLDLGGSHGLYSMDLAERISGLHCVVLDLPEVLGVTARIIRERNFEDRITLMPGDLPALAPEQGAFDIILAFNLVHGFSEEANRKMFRSIGSALAPGGVLYVLDELRTDRGSGVARLLPLMVGLNLLNEIGGTAYTLRDLQSWCESAGLGSVRARRLPLPGVTLVSALKPPSGAQ